MFEDLMGDDTSNPVDVLKSLLEKDNIELKTQLSMSKIKVLTQLKWFSVIENSENVSLDTQLSEVIEYYLALLVSLKRKSREETIKGLSEMREALLQEDLALRQIGGKK